MHRGKLTAVSVAEVVRVAARHHRILEITLDNGRTLRMSALHPTADGRVFDDLRAGDALGNVRVTSTSTIDYADEYTYDILPKSDSGTYVAAGALVASTLLAPPRPVSD
jgi:hypothetical protein